VGAHAVGLASDRFRNRIRGSDCHNASLGVDTNAPQGLAGGIEKPIRVDELRGLRRRRRDDRQDGHAAARAPGEIGRKAKSRRGTTRSIHGDEHVPRRTAGSGGGH
ncbi:MAG TPA: hypothetical protein VKG23_11760, partial [Thermoanaerobaculia bacterium]|nr:hypothetical protein [Thermoanaerobaculia bacterium]